MQAPGVETIDFTEDEFSEISEPRQVSQSTVAVNDAQIVAEIPEKRDEVQKEFLLDNGMQMVAIHPQPVHYEENGE